MTNGEWLEYLANNAPDELAAWFDSEHDGTLDGDTAALEAEYGKGGMVGGSFIDTPEQGEVVMPLESWREYLGTEPDNEDSREKLEADVYNHIAISITPNKEDDGVLAPYATVLEWFDRQAAITAEETSGAWEEYRDATQREIAELQAQLYELTVDCDMLENERDNLEAKCDGWKKHVMAIENAYSEALQWRDEYRSKFGKCIDYADAIHALMDDEGMA